MVGIVRKLPYGLYDGVAKEYLEINCRCCNITNDVESWMINCFLEVNCAYCGSSLNVEKLREKNK